MQKRNSPYINRFLQPDTIVPGAANPQAWNRYSYVLGNPLKYTDPTGHTVACSPYEDDCHADPAPTPVPNPGPGDGDDPNDPTDEADDPNPQGLPGSPECYPGELVCQLEAGGYEQSPSAPNFWPDYYIGSVFIPVYPPLPVFGINFSLTVDAFGNVYVNLGGGFSIGFSANAGGGWLLGPDNDKEEVLEGFLQGHSFNVSGGAGPGIGFNNVNPSYIQTGNEGSSIEDISIEGLITSPGLTGVFSYGWLIYDHVDDTP